jgi:hypothetical protein
MPIDDALDEIEVPYKDRTPQQRIECYRKEKAKIDNEIKKLTHESAKIEYKILKAHIEIDPDVANNPDMIKPSNISDKVSCYDVRMFIDEYMYCNFSDLEDIESKVESVTLELEITSYSRQNTVYDLRGKYLLVKDSRAYNYFNEINVVFDWGNDKITKNSAGYLCHNCDSLVAYPSRNEVRRVVDCLECSKDISVARPEPIEDDLNTRIDFNTGF